MSNSGEKDCIKPWIRYEGKTRKRKGKGEGEKHGKT